MAFSLAFAPGGFYRCDDRVTIRGYSPKPYSGDIVLFVATEMGIELNTDYVSGWRQATSGNVQTIWLPGGHASAFVEPHLSVFARAKRCF
jgi:thioesterase domain-containing protein